MYVVVVGGGERGGGGRGGGVMVIGPGNFFCRHSGVVESCE